MDLFHDNLIEFSVQMQCYKKKNCRNKSISINYLNFNRKNYQLLKLNAKFYIKLQQHKKKITKHKRLKAKTPVHCMGIFLMGSLVAFAF